jgi:hypothetical protein
MADRELKNATDLEFTDISMEAWRRYEFGAGGNVVISRPQWLHVSASGGHRILDLEGLCHYVAHGWQQIVWQPGDGEPDFVK